MTKKKLDDDTKRMLKVVVDHFDDEDRGVRDRQIRTWRRLKLLWENVQHVYYSEVAHDWRVPESERAGADSDQGFYDKPINVYRAYLESIIAALSVTVPPVVCYPDDADNPLDITTAKAGNKIAELVFRHNDMPLLWLHALFIHMTEGMTALYSYPKESEEYGTYQQKHYAEENEQHEVKTCPMCQAEMGDQIIDPTMQPELPIQISPDEFMPSFAPEECQSCGQMVNPVKTQSTLVVTRLVGVTSHPKSRICMEVYGGLFVKIPVWARNQSECSYLIYSYETHWANILDKYPELRDKVNKAPSPSGYDQYEQWGRVSPQYRGDQPENNVTVRNCWFRPCAFNVLSEDEAEEMKKKYPSGCRVTVVNDQVADAINENLDDFWTLTHNPLSDYLHFDPVGLLLTSVQDITNDLISLVVQTVEHGIPQTFADPKVLNFHAYAQSEVIPGGIYPATPKSGKPLSEGFYEVKTATLSQEVLPFATKIQEMGQMVSGALPSLFGGQMEGSRTASEYSMSRSQALQRLQSTWKMLTMWWKNVHGKVIPMYIKEMKDDEKQVKRDEHGNFVNIFIRRAELEGKIGSIEIEANENLPVTWNQQKDALMELLQSNNETIMQSLGSPENLPYLKRAIGLTDYNIPGEDDRTKQYEEIQLLVNSEPIEMPPDPMMVQEAMMMGMPPPPPTRVPSVEAQFDIDNHPLEAEVCRHWLVSDAGRMCKLENPAGYENVLLHMKMHKDMFTQMTQGMPPPQAGPGGPAPPQPPQRNAGVQMNQGAESVPTAQ